MEVISSKSSEDNWDARGRRKISDHRSSLQTSLSARPREDRVFRVELDLTVKDTRRLSSAHFQRRINFRDSREPAGRRLVPTSSNRRPVVDPVSFRGESLRFLSLVCSNFSFPLNPDILASGLALSAKQRISNSSISIDVRGRFLAVASR